MTTGSSSPPPPPAARFTPSATARPTRANTGVYGPDGTAATWTPTTTVNGDLAVTTDGQVIDHYLVHGIIQVRARNVVIRNTKVDGGTGTANNNLGLIRADYSEQQGALIEDCTLVPANPRGQLRNGITGHDFTARRVLITDVIDMIDVYNNSDAGVVAAYNVGRNGPSGVIIEGCFGGDFLYVSQSTTPTGLSSWPADTRTHNDWCQWQGGTGLVLRYNAMESLAGPNSDDQLGYLTSGRQVLSNMVIKGDVGDIGGGDIHDNWCTGGVYAFNIAQNTNHPITSLGSVSNNHFLGVDTDHGRYLNRAISMPPSVTSSTTTGNDDGAGNPVTVYHNG